MIKELQEEKNNLDLRIIKINSVIESLENLNGELEPKRNYKKKPEDLKGSKPKFTGTKNYSNERKNRFVFTPELSKLLNDNLKLKNEELITLVKDSLDIEINKKQVADFFYTRGLSAMRKRARKIRDTESKEVEDIEDYRGAGVHFNNKGYPLCNYKSGKVILNLSDDWNKVNCGRCKASKEKLEKNIGDTIGVHLNRNSAYACNPGCNANPEKMSRDWKYINCKNCIRKFKDKIEPNKLPERSSSGRIISKRKKLFPDEIDGFIRSMWKSKTDIELRLLIGEKFGKYYDTDQIKSHRKQLGLVGSMPGPKENSDETRGKSIEDLQAKYESDDIDTEEMDDMMDD